MSKKTIRVTRDQVSAARALIELRGGTDKVDPLVRKIASASQSARRVVAAPST